MRPLRAAALLAVSCAAAGLPALRAEEPVTVQASADRATATVGDRIVVKIAVAHPPGIAVLAPVPVLGEGSTLVIEPASASAAPGAKTEPKPRAPSRDLFFFSAQAFETGKTSLPAFRVDWTGPGGKRGSASSAPVPLEIVSVLKGPKDEPADIKPPAQLPLPPFPWVAAAIGAVLLALLVAAIFWWRRRRRKPAAPVAAPAGPPIPPHELAYRELERLLASGLLRSGKIKEFHVELAEIIKTYLAGRFGIETLERTSGEVLEAMRQVRVGSPEQGLTRDFFNETDLVKFAKYFPAEEEIRRTVDRAYKLVDQTKLVTAPPPPAPPMGAAPPALSPEAAP
ncbi:MAG TPA: hypothetical protein VGR67_13095 [Candidatus Polarisedimenticolia bacterium]|jgi:hypothetical protein|nr:hypothetical protein [Candidatus Polarisedimenticolia bacterium]